MADRRPGALLALVAAALLGCRRPTDVVLITIDTLRADHVGFLNPNSPSRTPNIDALAADGTAYTQAYSPISVTGPAFCSMMTGQDPGTHGIVVNGFRGGPALPESAETLAERLAAEGFATGAFVSGFTLRRGLGLAQGFQSYRSPVKMRRRWSAGTTDSALSWLEEQDGRVFLWWHSYDAHGPWERWNGGRSEAAEGVAPTAPSWDRDGESLRRIPGYQRVNQISDPGYYAAGYAAAIEYADAQVGRLVDALEKSRRYDQALIVLVADHGESLTERELWFDHGTTPHEEQLHVPLVIKWPDGARAGERAGELVSLVDIAPSVLDVVGAAPLGRADGLSLKVPGAGHDRLVGESSHCKNEPVLTCAPRGVEGKQFAVRDRATMVLHEPMEGGARRARYDRTADPLEQRPLGDPPAGLAAIIDGVLQERAAMPAVVLPQAGAGKPDPETELLQALGYVDAPGTDDAAGGEGVPGSEE